MFVGGLSRVLAFTNYPASVVGGAHGGRGLLNY